MGLQGKWSIHKFSTLCWMLQLRIGCFRRDGPMSRPMLTFVDDWEGEWSAVLPPDGILPTTETVDQAASAAYEYRFRWAGLLPDPEIDPNQVLKDPSIRLDRVNPPEDGMRHLVDEDDPESRRRAYQLPLHVRR